MMNNLRQLMQRSRNGNAVLFCGAGLTADCLNFDEDSTVGVTSHLLGLLNHELKENGKQSGFRDVRNAAKRFRQEFGAPRLMRLLKNRFRLSNVSASVVDIAGHPWSAIYTTNYDNGLELAAQTAGRKFEPINNTADPRAPTSGTPIIHLHGFVDAWNDENFEQSCVLDADSYIRLPGVNRWLDRLRFDIERAEIVVFIGFSSADFHLSQVFFNSSGLREKAFFINRPTAEPDPDQSANQEDFGIPLYIGREGFAEIVLEIIKQEGPIEPRLASFGRFLPIKSNPSIPPTQDVEDLFIWGKVVREHVKRDIDISKSDYHVVRGEVQKINSHLDVGGNIIFLHGDICDGKSLVVLGAINSLVGGRPVFELKQAYSDILNEMSGILGAYPNAVFVLENCFSLRDDFIFGICRQIASSSGGLILSARSISTEGETGKLKGLRAFPSLLEIAVGPLQEAEIDALIALIDQIAGWREFRGFSQSDRRRFVIAECKRAIPNVLLRLLNSDYVRDKYREEYNKVDSIEPNLHKMIVSALLISSLGLDAPTSFISDVFEMDFVSAMKRYSAESGALRLVRIERGLAQAIPSIGARNLLKTVVDDSDIVDTTIHIVEYMAESDRRDSFRQHIFYQLMRYSILSSVVSTDAEINRFFDHISKISYFRDMPLFWLQWHMAMCAQHRWPKAEEYLQMGNKAADAYEKRRGDKYNRKQLEDRKAKFLAARAESMMRSGVDLYRDMKEASDIVWRLLRDPELTRHPYETLLDIVRVVNLRGVTISEELRGMLLKQLNEVAAQAKIRLNVVPEGNQRSGASEWIGQIDAIISGWR